MVEMRCSRFLGFFLTNSIVACCHGVDEMTASLPSVSPAGEVVDLGCSRSQHLPSNIGGTAGISEALFGHAKSGEVPGQLILVEVQWQIGSPV